MGDDFPCKHRASTTEYRDGWELIWGNKEEFTHIDNSSKNQCDGCNAGYPIDENGLHIVPYPSGIMICQKLKYQKGNDKISHEDLFKMLDKAY